MEEVGGMPKENVRDLAIDSQRIELCWRHESPDVEGHVQLASVNLASPFAFPPTEGNESAGTAGLPFGGWYVTLDRDGINRLIRKLRVARDAAFGTDA